jgi:hypothetical protein
VDNSVDNPVENFKPNDSGNQDFKKLEVKASTNLNSRHQENGSADFQNLYTNQTYLNKNNTNHTEYQSIYPPTPFQIDYNQTSQSDEMDMINAYRALIHKNIDYEILRERHDPECIDEYVRIMLDAICSRSETVRVDRAEYPQEVIKNRMLKLDSSHIEYVISSMSKNTMKVRNIKNYLLTALYNAYNTIDSFYKAEVNHDLYSGK